LNRYVHIGGGAKCGHVQTFVAQASKEAYDRRHCTHLVKTGFTWTLATRSARGVFSSGTGSGAE